MADFSSCCKAYHECFCGAMGWIRLCPSPAQLPTKSTMDMDATERDAAVNQIRPILAGRRPQMQGLILVELTSIWLAGHPVEIRSELLALHCDAVRDMAALIDEERAATSGPPSRSR